MKQQNRTRNVQIILQVTPQEYDHIKKKMALIGTNNFYAYARKMLIEALVEDDYHELPYWTRTRVEHNGADYYLVGHRDTQLNGLTVRVRGVS